MRIAALVLIATLAGCAAQAAGPSASVDLNALLKAHPLYGMLAQYDRQIAALQATLRVPEFSRKSQAFEHAASGVRDTLDRTAGRARQIAAMPTPDVRQLSTAANAGAPSQSRVRADIAQRLAAQSAQVRADADQDMSRYRAALLAQQNTAFANYERSVRARVQQAYDARRQQLYEKESTLLLDLAKADAGKRLAIRAKLQTLTLEHARRHGLQAQLAAIQAREDAVVAQQRRRDQATLAAVLPPLQARADADIARMRAELQQRTAANLAARERVLAAQQQASPNLNLESTPAQAATSSAEMRGQLDALLRAQPADPNAFLAARDDLVKQFAGVRAQDDRATRSTQAEIASLQRDRARLYTDIISQIMRDAQAVARSRGFAGVYVARRAPPGSTDITQAVRADFLAFSR